MDRRHPRQRRRRQLQYPPDAAPAAHSLEPRESHRVRERLELKKEADDERQASDAFAKRDEKRTAAYSVPREQREACSRRRSRSCSRPQDGVGLLPGAGAVVYGARRRHWVLSAKQEATRRRRLEALRCLLCARRDDSAVAEEESLRPDAAPASHHRARCQQPHSQPAASSSRLPGPNGGLTSSRCSAGSRPVLRGQEPVQRSQPAGHSQIRALAAAPADAPGANPRAGWPPVGNVLFGSPPQILTSVRDTDYRMQRHGAEVAITDLPAIDGSNVWRSAGSLFFLPNRFLFPRCRLSFAEVGRERGAGR